MLLQDKEGNKYDIQLRKQSGEEQTTCPKCSHTRKKKKDRCLSYNHDKGLAHCHHCGADFTSKIKKEEEYIKPPKRNYTNLSDKSLQLFTGRGITQETVNHFKIVEVNSKTKGKYIAFRYFENGEVVRVKNRRVEEKEFHQEKDCKPICYNIESTKYNDYIIITEGEMDVLTWHEAGFESVICPPNGSNDNLKCIENNYHYFDNDKTIYVSPDNDKAGRKMKENLINRFGADRIKVIDYGDYNDANDVLLGEGKDGLKTVFENSEELPIDGLEELDIERQIDYRKTEEKAESTGSPYIDSHYKWLRRQVKMVTGIPNHGKTQYELWLMMLKSVFDGSKWAVFTPEFDSKEEFYDELAEIYAGDRRCGLNEYKEAIGFVKEHFFYIFPGGMQRPEKIREVAKMMALRYGIFGLLIDPYNQMDHDYSKFPREDQYLSFQFKQDKILAKNHNICITYIAHPKTLQPLENKTGSGFRVPTAYDVSGGSMWNNKMDIIHAVHRPEYHLDKTNSKMNLIMHKHKKQKIVGVPKELNLYFDSRKRRYEYLGADGYIDVIEKIKQSTQTELKPNEEFNYEQTDEAPF